MKTRAAAPVSAQLDTEVIDARLRELSRRLRRVAARRPASARALAANEDLQDILARNLEVAIQTCVDIAYHLCGAHGVVPTTAAEAFSELAKRALIERRLIFGPGAVPVALEHGFVCGLDAGRGDRRGCGSGGG